MYLSTYAAVYMAQTMRFLEGGLLVVGVVSTVIPGSLCGHNIPGNSR